MEEVKTAPVKAVKTSKRSNADREIDMDCIDCLSLLLCTTQYDPEATDGSVIPVLNEKGQVIVRTKILEIVDRL